PEAAPAAPSGGRSVGMGCAVAIVVALLLLGAIGFGVYSLAGRLSWPGGGNAAITLSPTSGPGGATVQVRGSGFQSGETVQELFQGGLVAQTTADGSGAFSTTFTVPPNLGSFHGQQLTVTAAGRSSVRSADAIFTIT